ncbi:MAG: hypothetical protein REI09_07535 [Candidatus Dactylopiibacterium sp.]|nr:hypothetical protein [Candidatus Dactylopiibacterium sp.]
MSAHRSAASQRGFALITVLILLIVMLIGGMALFRSTQNASLIAGNAAAKQAASQAGNVGLVAAQKVIDTALPTASGSGFSLVALGSDDHGIPTPDGTVGWYPATAVDAGDNSGYKYQYIIEKLCNSAGVCTRSSTTTTTNQGSLGGNSQQPTKTTIAIDLYRVTVKIEGPRSVVSYVQAVYGK